ncbi:type I secretion C-terminal target domain-containing protein [Plectonema radiosum NIES-515]|uniref:Type I secretion C-terminal target domain-containing protein n=1 Tax=Plectonema radiosum NIES-515 TaxID=2986073 RepID=A0ABT3B620_9CYAN|nr:CARDB domain-containing protein [Plectonema radiosum]MCV3216806.1 type I secretion C-terminal target domain-containing protein [Plectonema radiosum NIES-515]
MAPTNLTPGDIGIVGYITNGNPDSFSFANFVAINAGTIIYFTDNGWTGSAFRGVTATDADGSENLIRFTANADIPVGTVIRSIDSSANYTWTTSTSIGAGGNYANLSLSQSGEQIAAVQSTSTTNPLFSGFTPISQIDNTGTFENATSASEGNVIPGLSQAGNTAVLFNTSATYAAFNLNTLTTGTKAEWLAAISNPNNWTFNNSATSLPTGTITLSGASVPLPDLIINQTDSPDPVAVGNPLTYTLNVGNSGGANASDISVNYTVPSGVTFVSTDVSNNFTASVADGVVTFSGGSINSGGNATLKVTVIPNSTGTLTSGTATVDPLNAIAESNESNNSAIAITTTVNSTSTNTAPTIQADITNTPTDPELTTAFLSIPANSLAANPAAFVSGVINDPTDPARTLGIEFNLNDAETPNSLTVNATSSNQAVVRNSDLTITGTADDRNLKINPVGVGFSDITVTVSDGSLSNSYVIKYGASAASNTPATTRFLTGTSDASTAIAIDSNYVLVGDDENQVLRLYDRNNSGLPVKGFDFTSALGLTQTDGSGNLREVDIEASAQIGNRIFWLGSQSNAASGNLRPNRYRLFATDISGTGADTNLTYAGRYDNLRTDLIAWGNANGYNFSASTASGKIPEDPALDGFNIEGLTIAPNNTTGYVAFRAPNVPTSDRTKALIAPITNFASLVTGTATSAIIGAPIQLDLGGRGIREIKRNASGEYLIIAGPADSATGTAPKDFRLYTWTGNSTDAPILRAADLTALNSGGSFESIVDLPSSFSNTSQIQLLVDNGDTVWYNDGQQAKDLGQNNFKKFRSDIVTLGAPVAPAVRIHDIQGAAHISPLNGQAVNNVPGIVTALVSNGFYLQDPNPDNNDATSEGIFVFTSSRPTVSVGSSILVSGTVSEFRPGNSANNLTTTQISGTTITTVSTGNPLPAATILGNGGRTIPTTVISNDAAGGNVENAGTVFDPAQDGIDFYESLEGMLVQVNNAVAVGPTTSFGEIPILADNGANAGTRTARGGIIIQPGDFNPERIIIDDAIITNEPQVNVGDRFNGSIVGVIDYSFSNFKLLNTQALPSVISGGLQREVSNLTPLANQLTLATFNVENLDPGDGSFNNLASRIVNNLRAPDIINIEEIQDNNGPTNDSVVDASTTYNRLISALASAGGPTYQFRQINPVDDQDGGEPGGNIRVGFLFNPDRVQFVDRPGGGSTTDTTVNNVGGVPQLSASPGRILDTDPSNGNAFINSRKPLVGEFIFNGQTVFVVGNHFNSKGGDQPLFGPNQPPTLSSEVQRNQQAIEVRDFVQSILAINPNANVVVAGDLNDFEFSNPLSILEAGALNTLIETLPQNERYTYNFEGNAQTLDQILVSNNLFNKLNGFDAVHINSEFADQDSDHDPVLARFDLINVINGTSGRDTLVGTAFGDRITGGLGGDILTGGGGGDEFVYTNIRDSGDRITDFTPGSDTIVFTQLLDSLVTGGYNGLNAIADGYVQLIQGSTANSTTLQIDQDGPLGSGIFRPFIQLDNVSVTAMNNVNNFVF